MSQLKIAVTSADHIQGDVRAPVVLVEYGDYQCPACGEAYLQVKQVQSYFGEDLCFVFRNFPLAEVHPQADAAAETAEYAGAHGYFWPAHDALYENQEALSPMLYMELIQQLGLSATAFQQALDGQTYRARVRTDFTGGVRSGVNGTPTFFINGQRHDDSYDFETLAKAIKASA
ncbi:MAG: putative Membrane protein [Herminiimonas sp.]|nr:putative Membrane protein [Herminiimonas sp.]MDB5855338.1 putative Membrane protein [Herminiimonas sp.]